MKSLLVGFLLCLNASAQVQKLGPTISIGPTENPAGSGLATYTLLQEAFNFGCGVSTTCAVSMTSPTTANSILIAGYFGGSNTTNHISSGTGAGGTWALCAASACHNNASGGAEPLDLAYNLTGTGGSSSITMTISATDSVFEGFVIAEFQCTSNCGTIAFDAVSSVVNNASCTTCTAGSFSSLTGTSDLLFQLVSNNVSTFTTPVSSPYVLDPSGNFIYAAGSVSLTAPTATNLSTAFSSSGLAIK